MNYIEFTAKITPVEIGREVLIAELAEIGFESFVETEEGLSAYIQEDDYNESAIKSVAIFSDPGFQISYQLNHIEDQNWNKTWEENFSPILVDDRCMIRADFHEPKSGVEFDIVINPQMSFGTGHHETTHLMIQQLLHTDVENWKVLDMGCGTGVLAILAAMKGAAYVEAIDIDDWAFGNTLENVKNNGCEEIVVKKGGAEAIVGTNFDCILANINRNILLADIVNYEKVLSDNGILLLSGFFMSDKETLVQECKQHGLKFINEAYRHDWAMLVFKK
ncbi:MAG: 50S ribosomal protein L11 methyltransferase [Flavobacteriales bacterium]|nr:50S ribosomal protein L11 methyltransferase [Flavobacteriales bacterium]